MESDFFPYDGNDIIEALAQEKISYEEYRIVFSHSTMIDLGDLFYKQYAIKCGWVPHYDKKYWSASGKFVAEYPDQYRPQNLNNFLTFSPLDIEFLLLL